MMINFSGYSTLVGSYHILELEKYSLKLFCILECLLKSTAAILMRLYLYVTWPFSLIAFIVFFFIH